MFDFKKYFCKLFCIRDGGKCGKCGKCSKYSECSNDDDDNNDHDNTDIVDKTLMMTINDDIVMRLTMIIVRMQPMEDPHEDDEETSSSSH